MASSWNIRFPKDCTQEAQAQGKSVLALGYECGMRAEFFHYRTDDEIYIISRFALGLCEGADPRQTLEVVLKDHAAARERLEERKRLKAMA